MGKVEEPDYSAQGAVKHEPGGGGVTVAPLAFGDAVRLAVGRWPAGPDDDVMEVDGREYRRVH